MRQPGRRTKLEWLSENTQLFVCLLVFEIFATYQFAKPFLVTRTGHLWWKLPELNLLAGAAFLTGAALLTWAAPRLARVNNQIVVSGILFSTSLLLSITYTSFIQNDWSGLDVPYDSVGLAREAQIQGIHEFISTYNDRGNPGAPGSSAYADQVYSFLEKLHLKDIARDNWVGSQPTYFGRPFLHPPLFFVVLAGWMEITGSTEQSATWFMWLTTAAWVVFSYLFLRQLRVQNPAFAACFFLSLPGMVMDTWFPNYDVVSGAAVFAGFGLFILALERQQPLLWLGSGFFAGLSVMTRLTSAVFPLATGIIFIILLTQRFADLKALLLWAAGLVAVPLAVIAAGYNPILTLITAKFRQDVFYISTQMNLGMKIASITYLGIPLIVLIIFALWKQPILSKQGLLLLIPIFAAVLVAWTTGLSFDFHRNMLGVSACILLALAAANHLPLSSRTQGVFVGINLAFTLLVTAL